jgi:hypothetical protein
MCVLVSVLVVWYQLNNLNNHLPTASGLSDVFNAIVAQCVTFHMAQCHTQI